MALPFTLTLTDIFGSEWPLNQPGCPIRVHAIELGAASYRFNDITGASQPGVTVLTRDDDPNLIPATVFVNGPRGAAGRDILSEWRRANGRGMAEGIASQLMRLKVEESDRYADIRLLQWKNRPEWQKIFDCGRAMDELEWRNDNSYWFRDPIVFTFTAAQFAGATVANDGDVDTWPHVKITGPITSPTLGLAGETPIPLPTIAAGNYLDIEMDPDLWSITNAAGTDLSWVGRRWYKKAPAGNSAIPVTITGTGTTGATRLEVTIPHRYWSPL